jgi:hypothetical protein
VCSFAWLPSSPLDLLSPSISLDFILVTRIDWN